MYRPSGTMLPWRSIGVDVNGVQACDLRRGGGFATDIGGGEVTVAAHLWDIPEQSHLSWTAETGKTYFVRVRVAGESSGAASGLWGLGSAAASGPSGPFDLDLTDENAALASGVELRQSGC
ncbi:MAG TPA: hypothetical protein VGM32_24330 [Rhodopila sp.]